MHMPPLSYQAAGVITPLALQLMLELAAFGAFAVALATEVSGLASKKALPDKLGQQVSAMGGWLMLYTLLSAAAVVLYLMSVYPSLMEPWLQNPVLAAPTIALVGWTAGFCLVYRWSWKALRDKRGPHLALGVLGVMGAVGTLGYSLAGKLFAMRLPHGHLGSIEVTDLLATMAEPLYWALLVQYVFLALACAGALALIWLVLRRRRDDYGRDYYVYAARACARWAAWTALGCAAAYGAMAGLVWTPMTGTQYAEPFMVFSGAGAGLTLLGCLCWLFIARSAAPMRHKPAMFLGVALLWLGMAGMVAAQAHVLLLG